MGQNTTPSHEYGTIIVGAGVAGLRCAERLRRGGDERPITILDEEGHGPYDRPSLSKSVLGSEEDPALPVMRSIDDLAAANITVRTGIRATELNTSARQIHTATGEVLPYEHLVIATGSQARRLPGLEGLNHVHVIRTWTDALAVRTRAMSANTALVIGSGVLGLESAATLRGRGLEVHVIDLADSVLARLGDQTLSEQVEELHRERGVHFHLGTSIDKAGSGVDGDDLVVLASGESLTPDLTIVAVGSIPATDWLDGSGLRIDNGVVTDEHTRTNDPAVFAIGDAARIEAPGISDERFEHWTRAGDTATIAASAILADVRGDDTSPGLTELPYVWSDHYEHKIQILGTLNPNAEVTAVVDEDEPLRRLQLSSIDGRVVAVVGWNLPAAVNRCRAFIERGDSLDSLIEAAPWVRKAKPA